MITTVRQDLAARPAWQLRLLRIALLTVLTALSARLRIDLPNNPVPITAQTLVVLLAGAALGPIDGALSQIAYVGLIALGAPLDTRGLGPAVFFSPTAGYLLGFIPGAFVAGLGSMGNIGNNGKARSAGLARKVLAAFGGATIIHLCGILGLYLTLHSWRAALGNDIAFIPVDFGKALLAAALVNLGLASRLRWFDHNRTRPPL